MAANFWSSSHCMEWLMDAGAKDTKFVQTRKERNARHKDGSLFLSDDDIKKIRIHLALLISNIGRHQQVRCRQRVIGTATVYVARFYYNNSYRDFHPHFIAATAIYLASKVEESPVQPKSIVSAMRELHPRGPHFGTIDIVDGEYFLMEELRFNLVVFHPYRAMEMLMADATAKPVAGQDPERLNRECMTAAWHLINDSYRLDLCLYYPPHIIALAVILIAASYHEHKLDKWYDSLQFHPKHRQQILEVQKQMLELYEEYSHLEHDEIRQILDKFPPLTPLGDQTLPSNSH